MANINLLPWREELRQKRQKDFAGVVAAALLFSGLVAAAWYYFNVGLIDNQKSRNAYLKTEIAVVDKRIKEIKDIEKDKENLLARMEVIQRLQISRPLIVHLFDELVKVLPDGVVIDSMKQSAGDILVQGFAQSNARVAALMRNIAQSEWIGREALVSIDVVASKNNTKDDAKKGKVVFVLSFKQITPKVDEDDKL